MKNQWVTVVEYAKKVGKSKQIIYVDIKTGKIPPSRIKRACVQEQLLIKVD